MAWRARRWARWRSCPLQQGRFLYPETPKAAQVHRGHWGGLAGAPLGALAHLQQVRLPYP